MKDRGKHYNISKKHKMITNRDYRELFPEITCRTALNDLKDLVDNGLLRNEGTVKNGYYTFPK